MLKKLQRKFIMLTTIISVIVMLLIAVMINIINYNSVMAYSDEILNIIVHEDLNLTENSPPPQKLPKEFEFTTRFFVVRSSLDDKVNYVNTKNISSVSSDEAILFAQQVNKSGQTSGTLENYRYLKTETESGYAYTFLDIEEDIIGFENYLSYSVLILISSLVLIFALSCLLSKTAVKPIAQSHERQKRFITDVSHEFKTPLAIINADCDVIEIENGETEWTDSIKSQATRLNLLVENLISLTKLDEDGAGIVKTDFSLTDAVNDTLNSFNAAIKSENIVLSTNIAKNISYNGDEVLIRKLLLILTENAIKYSKGQIKTELFTRANKKIFTIENPCKTLKVGRHNNLFERFYRGDNSRSSEIKGYGIGLSIAKTICDKHGAKIFAESKTGEEIVITVVF